MGQIALSGVHDLQSLKQFSRILFALFEKIPEHAHVQRLPEAPGAGEKVYLPFHVKQFFNKKGLIYKIVISSG